MGDTRKRDKIQVGINFLAFGHNRIILVRMVTTKIYYRIDRREICFFHFIVEAYEGLATVTTIDPELGLVRVSVSPGGETDVEWIVEDVIANGIRIEKADPVLYEHMIE